MESEQELKIDHFSHTHPLLLITNDDDESQHNCKMCTQTISSATQPYYYLCADGCDFAIHVSCSEIPRYINHHFFHPSHSFHLFDETRDQENNNNKKEDYYYYECSICLFDCSNSFIYKCSKCPFIMDIRCSQLVMFEDRVPWTEHLNFGSPEHKNLFECGMDKNYSYSCSCCATVVDPGFRSVQVSVGWGILHISCRTPPLHIDHPFHPSHNLTLEARVSNHELVVCTACNERCRGYVYACNQCSFFLDFQCGSLTLTTKTNVVGLEGEIETFEHPHDLIFCDVKTIFTFKKNCCACGIILMGSISYCVECNALMHRSCSNIPLKIDRHKVHPKPTISMPEIHNHRLVFFDEQNEQCECQLCRLKCDTPFLCCPECEFYMHVRCVSTFPPEISYGGHVHPLVLTHTPVKLFRDDDDTEICDACEKIRKVSHRTYCCPRCDYVAHPHCVLMEIIQSQENLSNKESNEYFEEDQEPKTLSLKDFKDSFLKHDEAQIRKIEGECKNYSTGVSGYKKKFPLHLDEASEEVLKLIVPEEEIVLPLSNWDESSKLIKVGKCLTHENMQTTMRALFEKHGDFTNKSNISEKVKTFYVMAICDVVHSMCDIKVINVTTSQLASWYRCFLMGQYAGFEIKFVLDRLSKVVQAHFSQVKNEATKQCETIFDSKDKLIVLDPNEDEDITQIKLIKDNEIKIMQRAIFNLDREIRELKETLEKELKNRMLLDEWVNEATELEGQMAGDSLL